MRTLAISLFALASISPLGAQLLPINDAGVTFGHVHMNVTDVAAQKKFWTEQFGAKPLANEKTAVPGVQVPGMMILFTKKDPTHASEGTILDHFGFKVRNLEEMRKSLTSAGFRVDAEFKGTEGFPNAYTYGPDNIKIEMQQDTTLAVRAASHHQHFQLAEPMPLRSWYVEKMGLTATRRGSFDTANASGQNFTFGASKTAAGGTKGGVIDHIGLEVKNLEEYCKKLEAAGIKLDVPYRKVPALGIAIAFLTDPSGIYIELTEGLEAWQ